MKNRLTKQKNPEKFIRIIYELKKEFPNIKAIWVGTGELYDKCLIYADDEKELLRQFAGVLGVKLSERHVQEKEIREK